MGSKDKGDEDERLGVDEPGRNRARDVLTDPVRLPARALAKLLDLDPDDDESVFEFEHRYNPGALHRSIPPEQLRHAQEIVRFICGALLSRDEQSAARLEASRRALDSREAVISRRAAVLDAIEDARARFAFAGAPVRWSPLFRVPANAAPDCRDFWRCPGCLGLSPTPGPCEGCGEKKTERVDGRAEYENALADAIGRFAIALNDVDPAFADLDLDLADGLIASSKKTLQVAVELSTSVGAFGDKIDPSNEKIQRRRLGKLFDEARRRQRNT